MSKGTMGVGVGWGQTSGTSPFASLNHVITMSNDRLGH